MKRYPGIRPFRTDEQALFFGRDADIERLYRLMDLEQLVILYGKSGYGKSSLLSAGIFPRLQAEGRRRFREIRLGPFMPGASAAPAEAARAALLRGAPEKPLLPDALAGPSIWQALKNRQSAGEDSFLLVFDQFEELFTYPPEQILEFKKQLAEALYSRAPKRYENALNHAGLSPEQEDALYRPFDLKVVFSIRSDRMSLLNSLKDYLPNLLQHGYELDALDEAAATEAVVRPAKLTTASAAEAGKPPAAVHNAAFDTPPFQYAPETLATVFAALRDERGRIETSALQIVCRYVEDHVAGAEGQLIRPADLGEIKQIFRAFYERTIEGLPESERTAARRLVEDVLIKDGARMPYAAQVLLAQPGVTQTLLDRLAAASLLRVERDEQGRMIYEVGHDTLVAPIAEVAQTRRDREEKERLQDEAEQQRREKEKAVAARRKAKMVAAGAIALAALALVALLFAWNQYGIARAALEEAENKTKIAEKEKAEADRQRIKANTSARIAAEKTKLAEDANIKAQQSLRKAEQEEAKAKVALHQVEKEKAATEEQRQAAQRNYELAQQKTQEAEATLLEVKKTTVQVVKNILEDAAAQIRKLDYAAAVERLHDAARLVQEESGESPLAALKPAVADGLLEAAFFFTETDRYLRAKVEAGKAAELLGVSAPLLDQAKAAVPESRQALLQTLRALRPERYAALQSRYYPVMIPLAGGEYWMGCNFFVERCSDDEKRHRVRLRSFQLAETETTFWQYHLFLAASGKNIFKDRLAVGWGFEGDNPTVNVSWYDAVAYANWLSARFGLQPVYTIDSIGRSQNDGWIVALDTAAAGFRLPTEAEWEYAARGGSNQRSFIYAGADQSALDSVAWYWGNSESRTRAVRSKKPNTAGLYDMSGNVWEWCWDWRGDYPDELQVDPRGPEKGVYRVLRGGSWLNYPQFCRVASRDGNRPGHRSDYIGFRLVRPF